MTTNLMHAFTKATALAVTVIFFQQEGGQAVSLAKCIPGLEGKASLRSEPLYPGPCPVCTKMLTRDPTALQAVFFLGTIRASSPFTCPPW